MGKPLYLTLLLFLAFLNLHAQFNDSVRIGILTENADDTGDLAEYTQQVKTEINALLENRMTVSFVTEYCDCEPAAIQTKLDAFYNDPKIDILIGVGATTSAVLSQRTTFSKPTLASIVLDHELQGVPLTPAGTSGINNFSYIESPFSFVKDVKLLYQVAPFKKLAILSDSDLSTFFPNLNVLFSEAKTGFQAEVIQISVGQDAQSTIASIPDDVDAVYVFPLLDNLDSTQNVQLFDLLAERKLPSVALLGESMVSQGVMLGYESGPNLGKLPRRVALDVSKIVGGINAADLPVLINTFSETVVINMSTIRKVGTYPDWDMVTEAIVYNLYAPDTDRQLSLPSVIATALQQNLSLKVAEKNPQLAQKDVDLARSELLPQAEVSSSLAAIDKNSAATSFGFRGRVNLAVGGELSQLVLAEPAWANVAIQKFLQQGEVYGLAATQLDVIIDATNAFLAVLQAKAFMDIQAANVNVTKNNLDISIAKDAVGYTGATDLNRWKSELALDKIDLNDAQVQFEQAKFNLNQFLNHSIADDFKIEELAAFNKFLFVTDPRMIDRIRNEKELKQLADFMVVEAMRLLPELKQIETSLAAQQRLLKSQQRAFYLPTIAASGSIDRTLQRWDVDFDPTPDLEPTWNLGLGLQYPIFQGGLRKFNQEKTEINILQIEDQQADLRNQLELRVRSNLQTAAAAYFRILQYDKALTAATDNFGIVQDSYSQGLSNITNLIDAQNAKVQIELGAANADYQFVLDFMSVERAIGFYYLQATTAERDAFFERMEAFLAEQD